MARGTLVRQRFAPVRAAAREVSMAEGVSDLLLTSAFHQPTLHSGLSAFGQLLPKIARSQTTASGCEPTFKLRHSPRPQALWGPAHGVSRVRGGLLNAGRDEAGRDAQSADAY